MKLRLLAALFIAGIISTPTQAIDNKEFAKCASMTGGSSRLSCYDNLAQAAGFKPAANSDDTGKWSVDVDINPIDDSKTVIVRLNADKGTSRFGESVFMILRCKSQETEAYIGWNSYLGREARVLTRVGSEKAVTSGWIMSTDNKSTFSPNPIGFIKQLLTTDKLVAQTEPYNSSPITAIFNTSGINNAIKPLRENCNW